MFVHLVVPDMMLIRFLLNKKALLVSLRRRFIILFCSSPTAMCVLQLRILVTKTVYNKDISML